MKTKTKFKKSDLVGWLIMLPTLILFAFYIWQPFIENVRLSLFSTVRYEIQEFVGLDNYIRVLKNPDFLAALKNTFLYTFWSFLIGFVTPIVLAVLISETVHLRGLFRTGIYFPNIVPGIATIWIWNYFFTPGDTGVLNILLSKIGIEPQVWLNNTTWTIPLIVIVMTWKSAGSTALIYMANISSISPDLYEAATIDGANIWKRIRHITLPSVMGLAKTLAILQFISVFQIMYEPMILKNGGPNNASISLMMLQYRYAFRDFDFSGGAALSAMICVILVILSAVYMKITAKKEEY
ncbi:MAG: sugar ABC transporter permease [Lachnospiraceae bacterium]|nr:sugar ABC transporter permease [Lachnospiraceae bacterium]